MVLRISVLSWCSSLSPFHSVEDFYLDIPTAGLCSPKFLEGRQVLTFCLPISGSLTYLLRSDLL